jgi:hypothetical protein
MVIGSRVSRAGGKRRPGRHHVGKVLTALASIVLQLGIHDTQCGAKLFRTTGALRAVFAEPFTVKWVFDVEILARFLVLAQQGNMPADTLTRGLIEYPVEAGCDIPGSKIRLVDIIRGPFDLCRIYRFLRRNLGKS